MSGGDDHFGLLRIADASDGAGGNAGFAANAFGKLDLIAGAKGNAGRRHDKAAGGTDIVIAERI